MEAIEVDDASEAASAVGITDKAATGAAVATGAVGTTTETTTTAATTTVAEAVVAAAAMPGPTGGQTSLVLCNKQYCKQAVL